MQMHTRALGAAVAALVGLGGALVPAGTAAASTAACDYRSYDSSGSIFTSWKGDWTIITGNKALFLQTARDGFWAGGDRSSAYLSGAEDGDSAWVEIEHGDKPGSGDSGTVCGTTTDLERDEYVPSPITDPRYGLETKWYWHSSDTVTGRWMRACADVGAGKECTPWYDDH
ncbi:hypothetical protein [Streptomyces sp. enrichment culture]|uniref:hypothetical protein n=1 Tax=Streptomyces sp. enrichment culture TaxID=1795815 RepID=UPI003F55559C